MENKSAHTSNQMQLRTIEELQKLTSAILESNPEIVIYALDCNYRYITFNTRHKEVVKKIWGADIEVGMNILTLIGTEKDRLKIKQNFDRAINGENYSFIEEIESVSKAISFWQVYVAPIKFDDGSIFGVTCYMQDITERIKAETALKEEMTFQEALLESIPGFFYVYNEEGRLIKWNKKHESLTGYCEDELSQMTLDQWYRGEDVQRVAKAAEEAFKSGYGEVEANLYKKNGDHFLIHCNGVRLELGGKAYIVGIGTDVTQQRKNEEIIRRSEARHKSMIENISDVITILDEKGKVKYKSPNVQRMFGWDQDDLNGINYLETAHPDDRDMLQRERELLLQQDGAKSTVEYRYLNKDGTYSIIELTAVNLLNNPDIRGILANHKDITERKEAERKIRESEGKYRLITENISDVIWVLNISKNKFTYVSPSIMQLRGLTPEEAMMESMENAFTPDSLEIAKEALRKNTEEFVKNPSVPKVVRQEFRQPCKNGKTVWVESTAKYRYNADGEIELVGASHDIEERKMAEEQIMKMINQDQLTGIYNRRFYEQELIKQDKAQNLPIALIMVDVNGLKLINDAFGHQLGDVLLQKIANILVRLCGPSGIVSRVGGDEFILLMPRTDANKANRLIEQIGMAMEIDRIGNVILSVSMGFAIKKDADEDMNEVFREAEDDLYRHKLSESSSMRSRTIEIIMNSLYEKNDREMRHSQRVGELCEAIAKHMNYARHEIDQMRIAGLMHDIGKIGIQDSILNKVGPLNNDEWEQIKKHSEIGYRILSSANEFSEIANYILEHQERWDGTGYPKGLKNEEISIQARIIAVADAYDAMMSDRTYRSRLNEVEAIDEIIKNSGTQFDPAIAQIFIEKVLGKELR